MLNSKTEYAVSAQLDSILIRIEFVELYLPVVAVLILLNISVMAAILAIVLTRIKFALFH